MNRFRSFLVFVFLTLLFSNLDGQILDRQDLPYMPLEVFSGFNRDSIIIPEKKLAQPVVKYGGYDSKVKLYLEGVGEVYVHHILDLSEEEYSFMEMYSRKPSSVFIQGIKRYGNFRMYVYRKFVSDSSYSGKPRIEFVEGLNSIIKTIYPLSIYDISQGKEMNLLDRNSGEVSDVGLEVNDFIKYVDPVLFDSIDNTLDGKVGYFDGYIQYDLDEDVIIANLLLGNGEGFIMNTFESITYDKSGNIIGHVNGFGPLSSTTITANHKFLYANTGGAITEDFAAPFVFRIYNLHTGKIIFSRRTDLDEIGGGAISQTNLGVFKIINQYGLGYNDLETYVIDHDHNVIYLVNLNPLCKPPVTTYFFKSYCECWQENGIKTKLNYYTDFKSTKFWNIH